MSRNIKQQKRVVLSQEHGEEMPPLTSQPRANMLIKGTILGTPKTGGKRRLFEVLEINEHDDHLHAVCRQITPNRYKSLVLTLGLIAGWFITRYLLGLVGVSM